MWQGIGAVVAGYAVMAVVVMATMFVWMSATVPGGVAAIAGAWVTASLTVAPPRCWGSPPAAMRWTRRA